MARPTKNIGRCSKFDATRTYNVNERFPVASQRVREALNAGWTAACDGAVALMWSSMRRRANEDEHRFLDVRAGNRTIQVAVSPSGRKVRVFVDGVEA